MLRLHAYRTLVLAGLLAVSYSPGAATPALFDALDSHEWIGEPWGSAISLTNVTFMGRRCLRAEVNWTGTNWALLRTKRFPLENWGGPIVGFRADVCKIGR